MDILQVHHVEIGLMFHLHELEGSLFHHIINSIYIYILLITADAPPLILGPVNYTWFTVDMYLKTSRRVIF